MSKSDKAQKLNAKAVEKLNNAITALNMSQMGGDPNLDPIIKDVLSGRSVATLSEEWTTQRVLKWIGIGIICLIGLVILGVGNAAAIFYVIWMIFTVGIPLLSLVLTGFSALGNWLSSITTFPQYGKAPSCDAAGCSSSASYVLNPSGYKEIRLCYTHKEKVENRARYAALFRPETAQSVVSAYQDLVKAARLEPGSSTIQGNLRQARELAEIVLERKIS